MPVLSLDLNPVLADGALYLAHDRIVCTRCAGLSALHTGRTIGGAPVTRWTTLDSEEWRTLGLDDTISCECGIIALSAREHAATAAAQATNLEDLRPGDEVIAMGNHLCRPPRIVRQALGPIAPGSPVKGVIFEPRESEISSGHVYALYPNEARGLTITYLRPIAATVGE